MCSKEHVDRPIHPVTSLAPQLLDKIRPEKSRPGGVLRALYGHVLTDFCIFVFFPRRTTRVDGMVLAVGVRKK